MSSRKSTTNDGASSSKGTRNTDEPGNDASPSDDKLFEPSLEMMVNDYDDESTLEMEEQMASTEAQDPNAELNSLQRVCYSTIPNKKSILTFSFDFFFSSILQESDMPIEELLALYNCVTPTTPSLTGSGASRRRSKTSRNSGHEKTLMPPPDPPKSTSKTPEKEQVEQTSEKKLDETDTTKTIISVEPHSEEVKKEPVDVDVSKEPGKGEKHFFFILFFFCTILITFLFECRFDNRSAMRKSS